MGPYCLQYRLHVPKNISRQGEQATKALCLCKMSQMSSIAAALREYRMIFPIFNPFPACQDFPVCSECSLICLYVELGSLYCKNMDPDQPGSRLIRIYSACFQDKI